MKQMTKTTGNNEWYTPAQYIEAARQVMGGIDVDPASCVYANETVQAAVFYDEIDDGLSRDWHGCVFMNPPYGRGLIDQFVSKLIDSYRFGAVTDYICLVNDCMDTQWSHALLRASAAVCFVRGRIGFDTPTGPGKGKPPRGQVFYYAGKQPHLFEKDFKQFGTVVSLE